MSQVVALSVAAGFFLGQLAWFCTMGCYAVIRTWWVRRHVRRIEQEWDRLAAKINARGAERWMQ